MNPRERWPWWFRERRPEHLDLHPPEWVRNYKIPQKGLISMAGPDITILEQTVVSHGRSIEALRREVDRLSLRDPMPPRAPVMDAEGRVVLQSAVYERIINTEKMAAETLEQVELIAMSIPANRYADADEPMRCNNPDCCTPSPPRNRHGLMERIRSAINHASAENGSNTPDFILARFLTDVLDAWNFGVLDRERWYGRNCSPTRTTVVDPRQPGTERT